MIIKPLARPEGLAGEKEVIDVYYTRVAIIYKPFGYFSILK